MQNDLKLIDKYNKAKVKNDATPKIHVTESPSIFKSSSKYIQLLFCSLL